MRIVEGGNEAAVVTAAESLAIITDRMRHLPAAFSRLLDDRVGLTLVQSSTLQAVAGGARRLGEVAEYTQQDLSGASRTVDGLVELGLIARRQDTEDRRRLHLELSSDGVAAIARVRSVYVTLFEEVLAVMPDDLADLAPRVLESYYGAAAQVLTGEGLDGA